MHTKIRLPFWKKFQWVITLFIAMNSSTVFAQNALLERNLSLESTNPNAVTAQKEIQDKAVEIVTEDLLKGLLGEERFLKNKNNLLTKFTRQSSKYIPYVKAVNPEWKDQKMTMTVQLKVSLTNLRNLLTAQGLLIEEATNPVFIPVVTFIDRVHSKEFQWWQFDSSKNDPFLFQLNRQWEEQTSSNFLRSGLAFLLPLKSRYDLQIPPSYQVEKWSVEDAQFLALYFQSSVIIEGSMILERHPELRDVYKVEIKLAAVQISNGRLLADIHRKFETEKGSFSLVVEKSLKEKIEALSQDLASQVFEVWQRGSFGSTLIRLSLRGKMNPLQQEAFKEKLRASFPQVKSIRERLLSMDQTIYEIDSSSSPKELSGKILELKNLGFVLQRLKESENEIQLQVQGG